MSAGTAVVASDLGAFRRVLDDGRCGALFTTGDPTSLAERLVEVLHDPAQREALRTHGSTWVRRYDWSADAPAARDLRDGRPRRPCGPTPGGPRQGQDAS